MLGRQFLLDGFKNIIDNGVNSSISIYSYSINSTSYDDDVTSTLTGSSVISGLVFPINSKQGSTEALLLEQGKLKLSDKVMYCGSFTISGNYTFKIVDDYYSIIENGVKTYDLNGSTVYHKIFLRYLPNGSLY